MLEELLNHIIPENVGHKLHRIGEYLSKHLILFVAIGCLKLLLNKPGTVLVSAEFNDVVVYILIAVNRSSF